MNYTANEELWHRMSTGSEKGAIRRTKPAMWEVVEGNKKDRDFIEGIARGRKQWRSLLRMTDNKTTAGP
jgi:hypothetical protein